MRGVLGVLLGLIVRLWLRTLRVRLVQLRNGSEAGDLDVPDSAAAVFAFWHGQQMPLLSACRFRARRRTVMVSWSADGALQAGALGALGLRVVRGSSSRGGARGLRALVRGLRRGDDALFAVDGPRGPRREAKPGAVRAAELAGVRLIPLACGCSRAVVLRRAWDRFEIPLPFSRVTVAVGPPFDVRGRRLDPSELGSAIDSAGRCAVASVEREPAGTAVHARPA